MVTSLGHTIYAYCPNHVPNFDIEHADINNLNQSRKIN